MNSFQLINCQFRWTKYHISATKFNYRSVLCFNVLRRSLHYFFWLRNCERSSLLWFASIISKSGASWPHFFCFTVQSLSSRSRSSVCTFPCITSWWWYMEMQYAVGLVISSALLSLTASFVCLNRMPESGSFQRGRAVRITYWCLMRERYCTYALLAPIFHNFLIFSSFRCSIFCKTIKPIVGHIPSKFLTEVF